MRSSERIVTPSQTLAASVAVFFVALWPLLTLQFGRPTSWFGGFVLLLCGVISVFAPAALSTITFIDIVRRRAGAKVMVAFVISLAGVFAITAFIYSRIHPVI
jgi:putative effector of murein hydrolase LrgA (UPF0299 family)